MRLLLPLLAAFVILAPGCTRAPVNPYEPDVASDVGAARIIVQDNHNQRVSNATILVTPGGASGATDEQGIFIANDLPPGDATVYGYLKCFADDHRAFTVKAGEIREVILFMDKLC